VLEVYIVGSVAELIHGASRHGLLLTRTMHHHELVAPSGTSVPRRASIDEVRNSAGGTCLVLDMMDPWGRYAE
jgi:hypothetical protein